MRYRQRLRVLPEDKMKELIENLTSYSRFAPRGIFPPPPAVKASLSGTKETATTKMARTRRTLEFIFGD